MLNATPRMRPRPARPADPPQPRCRRAATARSAMRTLAAGLLAAVVAVAGCAGGNQSGSTDPAQSPSPARSPVGDAAIADQADCRLSPWITAAAPAPQSGSLPVPAASPPPQGRIPEGFAPVAAVTCHGDSRTDQDGRWEVLVTERLEGDLGPLLAALAVPDEPTSAGACVAMAEIVPDLWLVDASGRAVHAHYPRDGCGFTRGGVPEALAVLTAADTTTTTLRLMETREALDAGCPMQWGAPLPDVDDQGSGTAGQVGSGSSGAGPSGAALAAPGEADAVRVCRYQVENEGDADDDSGTGIGGVTVIRLATGVFTGAEALDAEDTRAVLEAIASATPIPRPACPDSPDTFAVLQPMSGGVEVGAEFTVEIDGCHRLEVTGSSGGGTLAPPEVLDILAGA